VSAAGDIFSSFNTFTPILGEKYAYFLLIGRKI